MSDFSGFGNDVHPFDARGVAKRFRHAAIFGALESLNDGETMRFVNDHDPLPLLHQIQQRYGDQVAKNLGRARHLVAPGQGHNVIGRGCLPRLAAKFVDTLQTAQLDAGCLAQLGAAPFFLDYNGASP